VVLKLVKGMLETCYFTKAVHVSFRIFTVLKLVRRALRVNVSIEF
jgi:hypothetical protein